MLHHQFRCVFCMGRNCNRCGHTAFMRQTPPGPIDGLHSNWVTGDVLACQRPSSRIIEEFDLIGQFRRNRITAIVNLQEPGEHPFCGDGINTSGFSYYPEEFMNERVYFYNFPWEDMCTPSLKQMLNIVKVMSMSVQSDNKVAVHCHAGFGRTGMVIACFLIYFRKMPPAEAVRAVRTQRGKCIEKKRQLEYVYDFARFIKASQIVFAIHTDTEPFTMRRYLDDAQYQYLHGHESRSLRYLPKVILVLCSLLNGMADHNAELLGYAFSYVLRREKWEQSEVARVMCVKESINHTRDWEKLKQENPRVLVHLLIEWLRHLKAPLLSDSVSSRSIHVAERSLRKVGTATTTSMPVLGRKLPFLPRNGGERVTNESSFRSNESNMTCALPPVHSRRHNGAAGVKDCGDVQSLLSFQIAHGTSTPLDASPRLSGRQRNVAIAPSSINCGSEILFMLDEYERYTIVCVLKVVKKLSKSIMYTDVLDVVASACTHRDFQSLRGSETTPNAQHGVQTHGLRESSTKLRRQLRLTFHCMALAAKNFTVPQISAFPMETRRSEHDEDALSKSSQQQVMKDICSMYRKLPIDNKNRVLSVLADIYGKSLEEKSSAYNKRPGRHATKNRHRSATSRTSGSREAN